MQTFETEIWFFLLNYKSLFFICLEKLLTLNQEIKMKNFILLIYFYAFIIVNQSKQTEQKGYAAVSSESKFFINFFFIPKPLYTTYNITVHVINEKNN